MSIATDAAAAALAWLNAPSPGAPGVTVLNASRYMEGVSLGGEIRDWKGYEGFPVRAWHYARLGLPAVVFMLNPDAGQLSGWIGVACEAAGAADPAGAGRTLARFVVQNCGAQFPVAGIVIETGTEAGGASEEPLNLEFRDGVTVRTTAGFDSTTVPMSFDDCLRSATATVAKAKKFARPAMAVRADYTQAGGGEPVGVSPETDPDCIWLKVSRESYLDGFRTGSYGLLNSVARRVI